MLGIKTKALAFGVAAFGLLGVGAAMAQSPDISGVYDLTTAAKGADGKPVCVERWTLGQDGDFLVESGQEQVRGHWSLIGGKKDGWKILRTSQTTNGLGDCMGHKTTKAMNDVTTDFYFNVDGNMVLSPPPGRNTDGSLIYQIDARLEKVKP